MILHVRNNLPLKVYLAHVDPLTFLDTETGEMHENLEAVLQSGSMLVFDNLPDALESLALQLANEGTLELYGDSLSAAWLRKGRRGVRFAGLQGYGVELKSFDAMKDFWEFLVTLCGQVGTFPAATAGGTAMRLLAALSPSAQLAPSGRIQKFSQFAYSAGARHSRTGHYKRAFLYDIHSAYPHVMRRPLPFGMFIAQRKSEFTISRLTINYDAFDPFSPLWVRDTDGKIFHPVHARNLTCILNSIDVETLDRHGKLRIIKEHEFVGCEMIAALDPVQAYLDDWQMQAPAYRQPLKIIRNAIYGKLAQRQQQYHYTLKAIDNPAAAARSGELYREYNGYEFGLYRHEVHARSYNHLPAAGAITALVRSRMYDAIDENTIAIRTDSILSAARRSDLTQGGLEGQWDVQDAGRAIVFGDAGFVINRTPHLDGVQFFNLKSFAAGAERKDRFNFGAQGDVQHWNLAIEKNETAKVKDGKIYVYHSPLAAVHALAPAPPL